MPALHLLISEEHLESSHLDSLYLVPLCSCLLDFFAANCSSFWSAGEQISSNGPGCSFQDLSSTVCQPGHQKFVCVFSAFLSHQSRTRL